jgi:hypothetical protein
MLKWRQIVWLDAYINVDRTFRNTNMLLAQGVAD